LNICRVILIAIDRSACHHHFERIPTRFADHPLAGCGRWRRIERAKPEV
jgi:hypothetical protein